MHTEPAHGTSAGDGQSDKDARFARVLEDLRMELSRCERINHQLAAYALADMMREKNIAELHLSDDVFRSGYSIAGGLTAQGVAFDEVNEHETEIIERELYAAFTFGYLDDIAVVPPASHPADWLIKAEKYSDPAVLAELRKQRDEILGEVAP